VLLLQLRGLRLGHGGRQAAAGRRAAPALALAPRALAPRRLAGEGLAVGALWRPPALALVALALALARLARLRRRGRGVSSAGMPRSAGTPAGRGAGPE
jgi:hypothetical protein